MSGPLTTAMLAELVRPFVNAKLNRVRDPNCRFGGYLPLTRGIDIPYRGGCYRNADVRSVTAAGVEVFFYSDCHLVPWDEIGSVTIIGLDERGNRTGATTYQHERKQAA